MNRKNLFLSLSVLALSVTFLSSLRAQAPGKEEVQYREFTGANGKVIKAVLIDKSDTEVILLLTNGARAKLAYDKLSESDQEYVRGWDKEKAVFLQQCRGLTVRELLELRGYESFKYELSGNSIIVRGNLNETPCKFLIDTGAGTTVLHLPSAKEANCKVGEMDQVIRGIAGETAAGWTEVSELRLGETILKDLRLLSADLMEDRPPGSVKEQDAIFGADFLTQLRAVISYKEGRLFLRPDLSGEKEVTSDDPPDFRLFKTSDGKTFRGKVLSKTASAVNLKLENGKELQWPISRLSADDAAHVRNWTQASATFMTQCRGLTVEELLELREYQSFKYDRRGNHIFVDGKLNELKTTFMIDTGADTSLLHVGAAEKANLSVGPMDQKIYGIGGVVMAGVTKVPSLKMGEAEVTNRLILATDLFPKMPQSQPYGAIFGADFMRELNGVITYRESRIFLRQD